MKRYFTLLQHNSNVYQQMLQLRTEVLLKPIGIDASFIKPQQEVNDLLIGAFDGEILVGCCVLTPRSGDVVQLRQMAVATNFQRQGIGAAIVIFAEQVAQKRNFQRIILHARNPVVAFYQKSGYIISGAPFEEVGILHYRMEKLL